MKAINLNIVCSEDVPPILSMWIRLAIKWSRPGAGKLIAERMLPAHVKQEILVNIKV